MGLKVLYNIYCVTPAQRQQQCLQRQVYQSTQQNNPAARPFKSVCSLNLIPVQLHLLSQASCMSTFLPRGLGIMRPDGGTHRVSAYLSDLARGHHFHFSCSSVDSVRSLTSSTAAINLSSSCSGLSLPDDIQQSDLVLKPFCIGLFYLLSSFFFCQRPSELQSYDQANLQQGTDPAQDPLVFWAEASSTTSSFQDCASIWCEVR